MPAFKPLLKIRSKDSGGFSHPWIMRQIFSSWDMCNAVPTVPQLRIACAECLPLKKQPREIEAK
jgi:hypothetical protein